jgi:hypothetical protein
MNVRGYRGIIWNYRYSFGKVWPAC